MQFTKFTLSRAGNSFISSSCLMNVDTVVALLANSFYFSATELTELKICFDSWEMLTYLSCNMSY